MTDVIDKVGDNARNGTGPKTVLTEVGLMQIDTPRAREGSFDPTIVRKRQPQLIGVDEIALSLTAWGLTTGGVTAHFDVVYDASVSKDAISGTNGKVGDAMGGCGTRRSLSSAS